MKVTLAVVQGTNEGRVMEFLEPRGFIIGRAEDADFKIADPFVSRRHVYLEICPPSCRLKDLGTDDAGSTNPPHVNGRVVAEADLKDGDLIELGYTRFRVSIAADLPQALSRNCRECGQPIQFLQGEPEPVRCATCAERGQKPVGPMPEQVSVLCHTCKTDMTSQANDDGRAAEFSEVATYLCEKCLPDGDDFAGTSIGGYQVIKRLGAGGMGVVFLVRSKATGRVWALKQLKDLTDALLAKRFQREMNVHKGLAHDNIVRCIDTLIGEQGLPYMVTEYASGGDLDAWVDIKSPGAGRLSPTEATAIISQVLTGLQYIHGHKIIHRDIKPQNILLQRRSATAPDWTSKIADFGLAKCYGRAGGTRITKLGTGMGTLMFMPPEQITNAGDVREPADLYAVGVTLYYLLTSCYTFAFPTPQEIRAVQKQKPELWNDPEKALRLIKQLKRIQHPFQIILHEQPTPIRQRDASIPAKLAEVVDRAVKKDARDRFQTAIEFRSALQRAVAGVLTR